MRDQYNEQLEQLNGRLSEMGALCEACIDSVAVTLSGLNADGTKNEEATEQRVLKIYRTDAEIDEMERTIEAQCLRLLLKQQPVAGDLRFISAALKMISDMERIGDQCADIADIAQFLDGEAAFAELETAVNIRDMAAETMKMVTKAVDSFIARDLDMARQVVKNDDIVDEMFNAIREKIADLIAARHEKGILFLDLLMIAKYFERIGDHATNVAEWVEFAITGEHEKKTEISGSAVIGKESRPALRQRPVRGSVRLDFPVMILVCLSARGYNGHTERSGRRNTT